MTKRNMTSAILIAVVVSVMLAGLVAARPDTFTNSNMDQNANTRPTSGNQNTNASMLDSSDKKFMMEAGMGGMAEVEMGRVALQRASNEAVKQYAQRMIDDHTKAGQELMELASTKGVTLATALDTKHTNMLTKMQQLSGAEFDRAYIKEAGVKSHEKMEKLFMREAERGKDADAKAFASKTLPTVQDHLRMAREMAMMGKGSNTNMSMSGGNSNMSGNMNSSGNSNVSNSNMSGNMNMSNSNMSNSNMSGNDNMSGNSNTSNSNGNSNMTNSNGNSNNPR